MEFSDDIEHLIEKGWVVRRYDPLEDTECFALVKEVAKAILHNECFSPEGLHADTLQEFMDKVVTRLERGLRDCEATFLDDELWMGSVVMANQHLPFCQTLCSFQDFICRVCFSWLWLIMPYMRALMKTLIWKSMFHELSDQEAEKLAQDYDFSGGQIENVARKRTVDAILYGTKVSWQDINGYCQAEVIAPTGSSRSKIGFRL